MISKSRILTWSSSSFLLLLILFVSFGCSKPAAELPKDLALEKLNVLLILVDTLGAKHTSPYNQQLTTSPALKDFAARSLVFKNAYSVAPWTKPSISSMFTSLYPSQHKADRLYVPLDKKYQTLPERMQAKGFKTVGYVSHVMLSEKNGFAQGFNDFALTDFTGGVHDSVTAHQITDRALSWFDKNGTFSNPDARQKESQFFMFLHYFDTHFAYQHHEKFDRTSWYKGKLKPGISFRYLRKHADSFSKDDLRYLTELYHEEIAYTDSQIDRLLQGLRDRGVDKNTLIIFVADHGEEFYEHAGMGHSHTLYNELIHVPFIVSLPGVIQPGVVNETVSLIDILPTIESLASKPVFDEHWQGESLKDTLISHKVLKPRSAYSEVNYDAAHNLSAHQASVIEGSWKLILDKPTGKIKLFDLQADPDELQDLSVAQPELAKRLEANVRKYIAHVEQPVAGLEGETVIENSPEEIKQLKSLGYL